MDAKTPSRSIIGHLRGAWRHAAKFALDIALPTLCVACREPVDGEGVCAECWAKLSFIEPPFCPRLGIPFVYDPGPELLSMEAIAHPPAYSRARAAVRYDDVARDRKSTRLNSSHVEISYAVFCLKKKKKQGINTYTSLYTN